MIENVKPVTSLQVADLQAFPVWQYTNREGHDETYVRPVKRIPVKNLGGKVVGTQVVLSNGTPVWATIENVDQTNARLTEHFLTLAIERDGRWFTLARYHDFDYDQNGPGALAQFLSLPVDSVFPITYDIRRFAQGEAAALSGQITSKPRERLSRAEIIALAVP